MRARWPEAATLRAAWWAHSALRRARRELADGQLSRVRLAAPPPIAARGARGVNTILRLRRHTCLEGALVRQRWLAAQGVPRDVVIGVSAPSAGFVAHAWIEGTEHTACKQFVELTRLAP